MLGLRVPMRAALFLAVVLSSACATSPGRRRGEALCWWRDVPWRNGGALVVQGTSAPLGRALEPSTVAGTLRRTRTAVVLRGRWQGDGLSLEADVDVTAQPVLASWAPRRIGTSGLLLAGAPLQVLDAVVDGLLVTAPADASQGFTPYEPLALSVRCEDVSLRRETFSAEAQVKGAGARVDTPVRLSPGVPLELHASPAGDVLGLVNPELLFDGFELQREGAFVRVALPTGAGVPWLGWVDAARVVARAPESPRPELEAGVAEPDGAPAWQTCDEDLKVAVKSEGEVWQVGTLKAGTGYALERDGAAHDAWVPARLSVPWFRPAAGAQVLLPRRVGSCRGQ